MMIEFGEIKAMAIEFQSPINPKHSYVVGLDELTFMDFLRKYPDSRYCTTVKATGVNLDAQDDKFFLVFVSDCYAPPIAVVRAGDEAEAIGWFVDELDWTRIFEEDLKDYETGVKDKSGCVEYDEVVCWNSSGEPYNSECLEAHEILGEIKIIRQAKNL